MSDVQDMIQFSRPTNSQLNLDLYSTTGAVTGCPGSASNVAGAEGCPGPSLYMVGGRKKSRRYSKKMHSRLGRKKYRGGGYSFQSQPQNSSPGSFGGGPTGHLGQFEQYDNSQVAAPSNMGASQSYGPEEMSSMATSSGYITGGKRRTRRKSKRRRNAKNSRRKRRTRSRRGAGMIEDTYRAAMKRVDTFTKNKKCPEAMAKFKGDGEKRLSYLKALNALNNRTWRRPQDGHHDLPSEECPEPAALPHDADELAQLKCVTMDMDKEIQCRAMKVKNMKQSKCSPGCVPSAATVSATDAAAATVAKDAAVTKEAAAADDATAASAATSAARTDDVDAVRDAAAAKDAAAQEQIQQDNMPLPPTEPESGQPMPQLQPQPSASDVIPPLSQEGAAATSFPSAQPNHPFQAEPVPAAAIHSGGRRRTRNRRTRNRRTRNRRLHREPQD